MAAPKRAFESSAPEASGSSCAETVFSSDTVADFAVVT
jgi:hypothetical protein